MAEKILIWAQTNNGTIALNGAVPWRQKADMKFFKEQTIHQVALMGRNTMLSFGGRALPERINMVLTHDENLAVPAGFDKVYSMDEAEHIADENNMKLAVIGGKAIYDSYLPVADILYVTYLDTDFMGDVLMAPVDKTIWLGEEIASGPANDDNQYDWRIVKYTRR
ncbi:dihydrofolate reductase [Weissella confusa]|uniref:dihydrofolate reductase n=1 Tax=Weissella confusa TaxID=1583 RepID=A0AAE2V6C4_WEICO|nr:dihydrofolate reductase [Weissella confusa]MBJ7632454.1 dihydrofolate reductase [Weissella confusa]MBJ7645459.1 dihydrofolate reductase [Weissella confusa]TGE52559.1 dihydrofolate reductase [Weissella confusa]